MWQFGTSLSVLMTVFDNNYYITYCRN